MKRFTLISAAIAATLTASAQWNVDNNPVVLSGTETGQIQPKVALTKDGKMYLAWRTAKSSGKALCYSFPHLQLLDKDGNALFGVNGLAVSEHRSPSWNSDYSLVATSDGCAIISNADSRSEEAEDLELYNNFTPVWYKIDQEQNFVWGLDGLALTDRVSSPFTDTFVVGDDVWIQDKTSSYDDVNYFNRVSPEGTLAFTESQEIFGQIIPSTGTDFISINSGSNGAEAIRYTREAQKVWDDPAVLGSTTSGGYGLHPYKIDADGNGGAYVTWVRFVGDFGHMVTSQHVSADGSVEFGLESMDVMSSEDYDIDYPMQAVDTKNNTALIAFAYSLGNGVYNYSVQKFNATGDRLFGDTGKTIDSKTDDYAGWAFNNYGVLPVGDGEWLLCYSNALSWASENLYVARINKDGEIVWKQQIGETESCSDVNFVKGDNCSYVVYKNEDDEGNTMLKGARIFDNGTFSQSATTALPYNIDFKTSGKPTDWAYLDMSKPESSYGHWAYGNSTIKIDGKNTNSNCVFTGINFDDTAWDDYYISPEFKLDANKSYKVKTQTMTDGKSYELTLEYGTSLTDATTFTKFADCDMQENNFKTNVFDEKTLKITENGIYRIAFHVTSENEGPMDNVYLFSFSIEEAGSAGIDNINENLSEIISTTIRSIDGKLVQTIKGDKFNSTSLAPGMYIITVKDVHGQTKSMKITK